MDEGNFRLSSQTKYDNKCKKEILASLRVTEYASGLLKELVNCAILRSRLHVGCSGQ